MKANLPQKEPQLLARWEQMRDLEGQVTGLRERSEARETVDRAKRLLEARLGCSEPEAFAMLRRAAMDRRVTLAEAAAAVLAEVGFRDLNLGPETPSGILIRAIDHYRPRLVWMAVSRAPVSSSDEAATVALRSPAATCLAI